jgi:acetyl-CoA C-acetyltransferase
MGSLSSLTGPALSSTTIDACISQLTAQNADFSASNVTDVILGNVISAGIGQAPARQAWKGAAGAHNSARCTTINKVCASGMKSAMYACQAVQLGNKGAIVAGGFESMSKVPFYLPNMRGGNKLGNATAIDGVIHDGLWDLYNNQHMGMCAEKCAADYSISREDQDAFAVESYRRAAEAVAAGKFEDEIAAVTLKTRKGETVVDTDEEPGNTAPAKIPSLRSAFKKEGTVTAANASSLNDGACAMIIMDEAEAQALGLKPVARVLGFADAEQAPEDFTTAPALAVPLALEAAGLSMADVDYHEINEAFSVVALANMKIMDLDPSKVNVNGGAVALGHPIGMSGARIIGTLANVLKQNDGTIGVASICNGGGGASAFVIERM